MARTRQRKLFDDPAPPWEGEETGLYAEVVFNRPLRQTFTYSVPAELSERILAGKRVLAPFGRGNHRTTGYCVRVTDQRPAAQPLKSLASVLDDQPLLSPSMLALTSWIADYYYCGWGQVLEAVLPGAVKHKSGTRWAVFLQPLPDAQSVGQELTVKQRQAFESLCQLGRPAMVKEIGNAARCGPEVVKALIQKGWVRATRQRVHQRPPKVTPVLWGKPHQLNAHQQAALDRVVASVVAGQARSFLLHGVTGSGKTEVYLRAIEEVVKRGREAIVLVPEISLTPQTIERFRQRFDHVAVLHSHLSDVDRHWYWQRIASGDVQVVVGARSAVFAPCQNLGLIVLDEEHETTFKQETAPRYHAREVAVRRAQIESVPVVLGSATPSLESWHAAQSGIYELLSLPERVADLKLPRVGIVDLRGEYRRGGLRALSRPLAIAIEETVRAGGQVMLLLNRRGFSTTILCPQCGRVETCRHCEISLTYHQEVRRLLCHSCDAEFPLPRVCAQCGAPEIRYSGFGTERLEDEVRSRFPGFSCERMDSDTMRSAAHYERVLTAFRAGKVSVLVGTQMIAKGLDFPNVHLVGVVTADTARNLPDFRASERTFQLVAQVAGRTGRGEIPGRVLVQTFNPDDPAVLAASRHDYARFVARELPLRSEYGYPPFQTLVRVIVRSKNLDQADHAAQLLADRFRQALPQEEGVRILGPAPAPVAKLRDYHRFHFQIHTAKETQRRELLEQALADLDLPAGAEFVVDVDPINLM